MSGPSVKDVIRRNQWGRESTNYVNARTTLATESTLILWTNQRLSQQAHSH